MTIGIEMGQTRQGAAATLDLEELISTRLLVQGNSGSGKSHLLRRLLEQSALWVQQVVIDPEGDFVTLADRFGHLVIDAADHSEATLARAADRARRHRVSVVLNLDSVEVEQQLRCAAAFLGGLFDVERDAWSPVMVVVDEAQLFAPAMAGEASDEARRASLAAMTNLMCRGRKRGLAGVIATQRLAKLAKNVAAEASNFMMGRTFLDIDMARAADLLGMERRQAESFRDLERGHFVGLGPALSRRPVAIRIGGVETASRSAGPQLMAPPMPATAEEARELILEGPEPEARLPAPRRAPRPPAPDILLQLAQFRPPPVHQAEAPAPLTAEEMELRKARIDATLHHVLADEEAAFRPAGVLYQDFLVRLRIQEIEGPPDLAAFRRMLATARAGVAPGVAEGEEWQAAVARAEALPEDAQGVYLLLARAARDGLPCPSDATIARAYGTRSAGRARRLLTWMEEQKAVVLRSERGGKRSIALVGLGWETTAGDPNGPDQEP
ncbi:ATP-binding protein [Roseococcus sp. SYP-B2431]|uniref:ATP-binding protein n=1 Tax=Roseococcus sp. SYP-B2431 TaxID=2496640 RepID=UPI00103B1A9A|nr:ATP-binding protein [Roseococcus sp. SYP-B2431]TCH99073.1 ATP-binding protein [Roseococcus sp. SYP-B2431]